MKQFFCLLLTILLFGCSLDTNPIKSSLRNNDFLKEIIKDKEDYQIQILLTKINQNNTQFDFNEYEYQLDDNQYFYPASTNKLPIVILTLKKINELRSKGSEITLKSKIILNYKDDYSELVIRDSITSFQNLIEDVFLDICGFPAVLRSDRGTEFTNDIIAAVNKQLHVKHTFGAAFHPQSQGYIEGRHKAINNVLKAYVGKNKHHWATFSKLAQWSMRSTPRKDRGNKSPYEIVTGLKPQGPFDAVFEKFNPDKQTPSVYVNELNKYLGTIKNHIAEQLVHIERVLADERAR